MATRAAEPVRVTPQLTLRHYTDTTAAGGRSVSRVGDMTSPETALERLLRDHRHDNTADVSVAVMTNGQVHAAAWGCTTNTLFQAASISKPVAAVAAMVLVDRQLIGLDEDLTPRLTSWPLPQLGDPLAPALTLRHLLCHTGGLTVRSYPGYARTDPLPSLVQILTGDQPANTTGVRRKDIPGRRVLYCGGGFTVVQQLIADITGKSFPDAMRDLVFRPLGMTRASYTAPDPARAAHGHVGGAEVAGGWRVHPEYAAAGLWCTPTDLVKLAAGVQAAAAGTGNLMSQATALEMLTTQMGEYGLGFEVATSTSGLRRFEHGGANEGYRCQLTATCGPGPAIAIMTGSDHGHITIHRMLPGVRREFGWPDVAAHQADKAKPADPLQSFADLDKMQAAYGGAYKVGANDQITMTGSHMNWIITLPNGTRCPLDVISPTHLMSGYPAIDVWFSLNNGYATKIFVHTDTDSLAGDHR